LVKEEGNRGGKRGEEGGGGGGGGERRGDEMEGSRSEWGAAFNGGVLSASVTISS